MVGVRGAVRTTSMPRQVFESTGGKLTGAGRFADGTLDPGHHAGDLGANTEAEDREHARVLCSVSVSRSSLAYFAKLNDPAVEDASSQDRDDVCRRDRRSVTDCASVRERQAAATLGLARNPTRNRSDFGADGVFEHGQWPVDTSND